MALATSTKTKTGAARKAASSAARATSRATRNPLASALVNLSPDELANPSVQRALGRMGFVPGAQGVTGFVNGGPLASGFGPAPLALPASTGSTGGLVPFPAAQSAGSAGASTASAASAASAAAQSAARSAGQATIPSRYALTEADFATTAANTPANTPAGRAGFLAWNPSATRAAAARGLTGAELTAAGRAGGRFAPGSLGRAGLYGMGGYLGANLLHGVVGERDGTWDDAAEGALKGAGVGAGIGTMILPGPGTLVGGLIGGAAGGLWGKFTGDDSPATQRDDYLRSQLDASNDRSLVSLMSKYGVSSDMQRELLMQLELVGPTLGSKDEAKALVQQVVGSMPALLEEDEARQAQASRLAAMQAYLLPMMRDSQAQSTQFLQQQATLINDSASRMSPSVAAIYRQHAADMVGSNNRAYQAQLTQMMLAPQLYGQQQPLQPSLYGQPTPTGYSPTGYSPTG